MSYKDRLKERLKRKRFRLRHERLTDEMPWYNVPYFWSVLKRTYLEGYRNGYADGMAEATTEATAKFTKLRQSYQGEGTTYP